MVRKALATHMSHMLIDIANVLTNNWVSKHTGQQQLDNVWDKAMKLNWADFAMVIRILTLSDPVYLKGVGGINHETHDAQSGPCFNHVLLSLKLRTCSQQWFVGFA